MLALLVAAPAAAPQPERPLLEWVAPASCPEQSWVDRRLAQVLPDAEVGSLRARAEVERTDSGYRLELELESDTGTSVREFADASCSVLADIAVFVVAVAIDPAVATTTALAQPEPSAPSLARAPAVPPAMPPAQPRARSQPRSVASARPRAKPQPVAPGIGGTLRAAFGVGTSEVSRLDLAPALWGGVRGRRWRAEIGLRYIAARPSRLAQMPAAGVELDALGSTARGCAVFPVGPIELPLCAGLELDAVLARPFGLLTASNRTAARVGFGLAAALAWPFTRRLALWLEAAGTIAALRPRFVVRGASEPVYLGPAVGVSVAVGLELRLGPPRRPG